MFKRHTMLPPKQKHSDAHRYRTVRLTMIAVVPDTGRCCNCTVLALAAVAAAVCEALCCCSAAA